jgi:hypothetical protein
LSDVVKLNPHEGPKAEMLAELEKQRALIESGEIIALFLMPIGRERTWRTISVGDIWMLELAGMLGRAWLDATERLKD